MRTIVSVFKTNVEGEQEANQLLGILKKQDRIARVNFDLQDCDRILRVESKADITSKVIEVVSQGGFTCEVLD